MKQVIAALLYTIGALLLLRVIFDVMWAQSEKQASAQEYLLMLGYAILGIIMVYIGIRVRKYR